MNFVFDLDGTICFQGRAVSEEILNSLDNLQAKGHNVIFASARPIRDMLPVLHERFHPFPLIGGNGALIFKYGKLFQARSFTEKSLHAILSLIEEYEATYLIDSDWDYAYTGPQDHPILRNVDSGQLASCLPVTSLQSIVKILILTANNLAALEKKLRSLDIVIHQHRSERVIDVSPKNIDKWTALQAMGIKDGDYVAFGNDANDITMFKNAGHSVMIGHHEQLSQFAQENIVVDEHCERNIVDKIHALASFYE